MDFKYIIIRASSALLLLSGPLFTACDDDDPDAFITVSKQEIEVEYNGLTANGETVNFDLGSNHAWQATYVVSSVAAAAPIPFQAYYSAAKAAVNSYTMALANELRPYGVTVCAVQPGDIHTGFTAAREKTIDGDDVYGGRISRSVARMEHDEQTGMDPAKAGAFIAKVAMKQRVKPIYTIRFDYQFLALLTRILPYRFLNWLIGVIYGK